MTEDEALEKVCCIAKGAGSTPQRFCATSDCMAWRWTLLPKTNAIGEGYCGLAGAPTIEPKTF